MPWRDCRSRGSGAESNSCDGWTLRHGGCASTISGDGGQGLGAEGSARGARDRLAAALPQPDAGLGGGHARRDAERGPRPLRGPGSGVAADRLARAAATRVRARRARRGQLRRARPARRPDAGARRRSSSSTGSPAAGRTGSRTSPTSHADRGSSPSTCRDSGAPRCPSWEISIEHYGRLLSAFCRGARPRGRRRRRQLDGRVRRRRGGHRSSPGASRSWCWSRPPGSRTRRCAASRSRRWRGWWPRPRPSRCGSRSSAMRRPKLREAAFKGLFRYPELLRVELLYETLLQRRASRRGSPTRSINLAGYDFLDRLERGRAADPDRLGPRRPRRAAARRRRATHSGCATRRP